MDYSWSTKSYLLSIFTILFFGVGVFFNISFLAVLGFYFILTPWMCCLVASSDEKSQKSKKSDEPRFPYNRPLRSIYQAPDPSFREKMAERAIELENFLEESGETSIEEPLIPKGSITKFQLGDGREISLELVLDVETVVTQIQKHEEKCSNEGKGFQKESDVDEGGIDESSNREDEEPKEFSLIKREDLDCQDFSLGKKEAVELQDFSLNARKEEKHQEFSSNKREDGERQEFSLDRKVEDEEHRRLSLDKVPLEFLYTLDH